MKVTDVIVRPSKGSSKIKAFAVIVFDDIFEVNSFKVVDGTDGLFVAMPSQRGQDGKFYNTVRIKSDELKSEITEKVLQKFNDAGSNSETQVFEEPES